MPIRVVAVPSHYADPDVVFGTYSEMNDGLEWRIDLRRRSESIEGKPVRAIAHVEWLSVQLQDRDKLPQNEMDPLVQSTLIIRARNVPEMDVSRAEVTVQCDDPQFPEIRVPVIVYKPPRTFANNSDG